MPTSQRFSRFPAFPDDLPIADIPTISLNSLLQNTFLVSEDLFEATREHGFFLLDLRGSTIGENLLEDADSIFDITEATLSLDKTELDQYAYNPPKSLFGYKSAGKLPTDDGKLDVMDMYMISQDDILENSAPRAHPETVESQREQIRDFFEHARAVIEVILDHFDGQLGLAHNTLASMTPLDRQSDTSLRLLRSPPPKPVTSSSSPTVQQQEQQQQQQQQEQEQLKEEKRRVTLGGHTDIGVITLLFHVAGGLQILPAGSENIDENWRYIKPEPNCALINIGDTMVEWTGGVMRSSLHRVVRAPGKQAHVPRLSLAYLIRPEYDATMRRLQGGSVIPPLADGEQDETRSVSDWAAWRASQIMSGKLKPQTRGGRQTTGRGVNPYL